MQFCNQKTIWNLEVAIVKNPIEEAWTPSLLISLGMIPYMASLEILRGSARQLQVIQLLMSS